MSYYLTSANILLGDVNDTNQTKYDVGSNEGAGVFRNVLRLYRHTGSPFPETGQFVVFKFPQGDA